MYRVHFISSGNVVADRRYSFAGDLEKRGDLAGAADLYAQTVEIAPGFAAGWFALGAVRERLGEPSAAVEAFRRARASDPEDRHGATMRIARLTGEKLPMPAGYVRALFEEYAPHYDLSLLEGLNYRGPELLYEAVLAACEVLPRDAWFDRALDLGCGTGLASEQFTLCSGTLVGVDLSRSMLVQARRTGRYRFLHVSDALDFVSREVDDCADLVVAADSLPYLPDLAPLFGEIGRVLEPGGLFAFTVEAHDGTGVLLRETLRYAHGEDHVQAALVDAGLDLMMFAKVPYRTEKGAPVPGAVAVAARSASTAPSAGASSGG